MPTMLQRLLRPVSRALRDDAGSPTVEFAFAAMPLVLMVVGTMEFGMIMFTSTLMESGLRDAARFGITGQVPEAQTRLERIIEIIADRTLDLVDMNAAEVKILVYPGFGDIGRGEAFVDGNGTYDPGETFTDENGNGQSDPDGGQAGAGGSGEIVVYRMRYDWPLLTPLLGHVIGADGHFTLNSAIAVRDEPWES
jgi:Flp pilus assembly protein TadG